MRILPVCGRALAFVLSSFLLLVLGCQDSEQDCRTDEGVCSTGTTCDGETGRCVAAGMDCRSEPTLCGSGTFCAANGRCLVDCRQELATACGLGQICNQRSGVCESVEALNCNAHPAMCWEDQVCDAPTGYCREASIDTSLAYDVQLYDYTLDVSNTTSSFAGLVKIFLVATKDDTRSITLDVGATVDVPTPGSGTSPYTPYTVTSVQDRSGAELAFTRDSAAGTLTVTLKEPLAANASEVLTVFYSGPFNPINDANNALYSTGFMRRSGKLNNPIIQTFGWPNFTRRWLPSHDHPSDIARAIAHVRIDNGFLIQANGVLIQESTDTPRRRTYLLRQPVPTYALHVIASDFTYVPLGTIDGVLVDAYMYPDPAESSVPRLWWNSTLGALKYFNEALGPYPFERYSMMQVPSNFGGMEHATIVSIADTMTTRTNHDNYGSRVAIHELLHHWWGDNAHQESWEEFWLNESLATFYTAEALGVLGGRATFQAEMDRIKAAVFRSPARYDDDALRWVRSPEEVPGQTTQASFAGPYYKGPWIWQMIRRQLGGQAFAAFMKKFYQATRFKKYSTTQLLAMLNAEGQGDFTPFFNEWIYGKGWPKLSTTWTYDGANQVIRVTARQTQDVARYGTYTLSGKLALRYDFDDESASTATCTGEVSFTGGATTATVEIPCAYAPTKMSQPFTADLFIEVQ